jgi:hypothetical protein
MKHNSSTYYYGMLNQVREQVFDSIRHILKELGGKVYFPHYRNNDLDHIAYTFFEVDGDGYGRELFLETAEMDKNGNIKVLLSDTESCYEPVWELADFNAVDATYLLDELEQIADYVETSGEQVVSECDW